MRIGIDARMYGPKVTGFGYYTEMIIKHLVNNDKNNEYVLFLKKEHFYDPQISGSNIKKILTDIPWYSFSEQIGFSTVIKKQNLDLMHFLNFNVPIFYNGKFVVTVHDLIPIHYPKQKSLRGLLRRSAYKAVLRHALDGACEIITVSEFSKQQIGNFQNGVWDKITVIYPGVKKISHKQQKYDIIKDIHSAAKKKKPYIFFVSAWSEHKNIFGLIDAFKKISAKKPSLNLVLAGENKKLLSRVKKYIKTRNLVEKVIIIGFVDDKRLYEYYRNAELTVMPSFIEGFGLPAIESLLNQTRVCAAKNSSVEEILGENGTYFNPHDPDDMAKKIENLLNSKKDTSLYIQIPEIIEKKFSWERCCELTNEVYKKAAICLKKEDKYNK